MKYLFLSLAFLMHHACCPPCVIPVNRLRLSTDEIKILAADCVYVDSLLLTSIVLDTTEKRNLFFFSEDIYTYLYDYKAVRILTFTECYNNSSFLVFQERYGSPQFTKTGTEIDSKIELHHYVFNDTKNRRNTQCRLLVENDVITSIDALTTMPKEQSKRRRFRW